MVDMNSETEEDSGSDQDSEPDSSTPFDGEGALAVPSQLTLAADAGETDELIFYLENSGDGLLDLLTVDILGDPAFSVGRVVDPTDPSRDSSDYALTLEPGEGIPLRVSYLAVDDEPKDATLTITTTGSDKSLHEVPVRGVVPPCIDILDTTGPITTYNLGQSFTGATAKHTLTVRNCGTADIDIDDVRIAGDVAFEVDESDQTFVLIKGQTRDIDVLFTPTQSGMASATLSATSGRIVKELSLHGEGVQATCGEISVGARHVMVDEFTTDELILPVMSSVELAPFTDIAYTKLAREWSILSKPADSMASLASDAQTENPTLFLDRVGTYEVEMILRDELGLPESCTSSTVTIEATAEGSGIIVEVVWDTPSDADQTDVYGTDIDLHYLAPQGIWDTKIYDAYWDNANPDWGTPGEMNNPELELDDSDGVGPERLVHSEPVAGESYAVGVYYYNDSGFGVSYATVRIFVYGQLAYTNADRYLQKENIFWDVARISWPMGIVTPVDRITNGFPR